MCIIFSKKKYKILIVEKNNKVGGLVGCGSSINSLSSKILSDLNINLPKLNNASYVVALDPNQKHTIIEEKEKGIIFHSSTADHENQKKFNQLINKYKNFSKSLSEFMHNNPPRLKSGKSDDTWKLIKMGWNIRKLGRHNMREFLRVIGLNIAG